MTAHFLILSPVLQGMKRLQPLLAQVRSVLAEFLLWNFQRQALGFQASNCMEQ